VSFISSVFASDQGVRELFFVLHGHDEFFSALACAALRSSVLTIALVFQLSPAESQTKESCGFAADLAESLWLSGSKNSR
jgi:hypothetical protein